jgi:hypothetical protein
VALAGLASSLRYIKNREFYENKFACSDRMADLFLGGSAIDRLLWGLLGLDEQPSDGMMKPSVALQKLSTEAQ